MKDSDNSSAGMDFLPIHGIMTLFKAWSGRMAISTMSVAVHMV